MDFLYRKLEQDIRNWYAENQPNQDSVVEMHIKELHDYYDPARFCGVDIEQERIKFLTELQGIVDIKSALAVHG
jgi:hypothetical protein